MPSRIGMTLTFISIVLGQLLGALVFDALGLFGVDVRDISVWRLSGLALAVSGVVLSNVEKSKEISANVKKNGTLKLKTVESVKDEEKNLDVQTGLGDSGEDELKFFPRLRGITL